MITKIQILNIVVPIKIANVIANTSNEKKYLDFIDQFSEYNFLILITNSIRTKIINGIVINSNIAPKKLFKTMFLYDIKIKHKKYIKQTQLNIGITLFFICL